jgi:hypothetical protein
MTCGNCFTTFKLEKNWGEHFENLAKGIETEEPTEAQKYRDKMSGG